MAAPRRVNPVEAALRRIAEDLTKAGTPWALIGGLAVSARAEPRTTRDVDVAVAVAGDAEAEALVYALQGSGYTVVAALEQKTLHRLSTIRLSSRLVGDRDGDRGGRRAETVSVDVAGVSKNCLQILGFRNKRRWTA